MKALIEKLVREADLTNEQAEKAAEVVKAHLADILPAPIRGHVESALTGANVASVAEEAKGLLGKLF